MPRPPQETFRPETLKSVPSTWEVASLTFRDTFPEGRADKVTNLSVMFWAVSVMYSISIMFPISTVSDPSTMAVMRSEP